MKFTDAQAAAIMAEARANVAGARADMQRWRAEQQQRDSGDRLVVKTIDNARSAPTGPAGPTTVTPVARTDPAASSPWSEWVDGRIAYEIDVLCEAIGPVIASERRDVKAEFRDAETALLRREVRALRAEIDSKLNVERELAAARSEIKELPQRAPNFESALAELREQNARQERVIWRLRGEQSTLEYQQRQLAAEQQKDRREVSLVIE
jgi:hypothetical protein